MSAWSHPRLGPIDLLPVKLQPKKVWRHFYDPAEHWERICDLDVAGMRAEVESITGVRRRVEAELPRMRRDLWRSGRDALQRHHDLGYGPTYATEMASPETIWTLEVCKTVRHRALTPVSIFLVIQIDQGRPSWVVTAYRPLPPFRDVDLDEADIMRHGRSYFRKATGMDIDSIAKSVAEDLRQASSSTPTSTRELWWLVSAIAYGRPLKDHPVVTDALKKAESILSTVETGIGDELRGSLDWDGCLGDIGEGLKDDRPEEIERCLLSAEELLAVAGVLGEDGKAESFLAEAELLIAWLPPEWSHLFEQAADRHRLLDGEDGFAARLWESVEGAAVGAAIREAAPTTLPKAKLVENLLPAESILERCRRRAKAVVEKASSQIADRVEQWLNGISILEPSPVMGGSDHKEPAWPVQAQSSPAQRDHLAVFMIDNDHPDGCDVTDHVEGDGDLWRIDKAGDTAWAITIASIAPLPSGSLIAVLDGTAGRDDVVVRLRQVNRPK